MLEFIVIILPGVIAAIIHCRMNNILNLKKIIVRTLLYTVCINFLIFSGLWIIGNRSFNIFDMSFRFKIKWLTLGIVLAAVLVITFRNIRKTNSHICISIIKRLLPATLFLTVTYAIFIPSSIFLENIDEFSISYIKIAPLVLLVAVVLWAALNLTALCLTDEKSVIYYISLIFAISFSAYVQRNFLNPKLPSLDGSKIDWSSYSLEGIISISFWILFILITFVISFRYKEKSEQIIKYASWFMSAMQIISLLILLSTTRLPDTSTHGFSKEGEFTVGSEENIIIFIVDCLQSSVMHEYLASDAYTEGSLDNFVFFDNAVSGGAPTQLAMPLLLTGNEYDPMQTIEEYYEDAWEDTQLYDDLHENGYDVRFYSTLNSIPGIREGIAENYKVTVNRRITDYTEFGKQLYKLVNFFVMPQFLKEKFWLSTETMTDTIETSNDSYKCKDHWFYPEMLDAGALQTDYKKAFRLYHLRGAHSPYITNENIEIVEEDSVTEQQQLQGAMKIIYTYFDEMRAAGVYDASTIVITGDHGRHEKNNPETNPAILIKLPYGQNDLEYNSSPVHFRNFTATLAQTFMDDYSAYGPSFYDITNESDVERLHTINRGLRDRNHVDDEWDDAYGCCRLIVPYETEVLDAYKVWNPYNINNITYSLGNKIDFVNNNEYAQQIDYRLYKEDGIATASNELSICFELSDYKKGNLDFHFTYSNVYNNEQNIKIYANGSRVGTVTCTSEGISDDNIVTIPKNKIIDNKLIIRMVFPNAVTPNQLDRNNQDTRILSVGFDSIWLE